MTWEISVEDAGDALCEAAQEGQKTVVTFLLENARMAWRISDDHYACALTRAAAEGHEHIVTCLLSRVGRKIPNWAYGSALKKAAETGRAGVLTCLLDHRDSLRLPRWYFSSALRRAAERGHEEAVGVLLQHSVSAEKLSDDAYADARLAARDNDTIQALLDGKVQELTAAAATGGAASVAAQAQEVRAS